MGKGLSVPDSELLIKLAEILEVPVSRLLGSKIEAEEQPDALAEQLSRINEQLAIKNRRAKRVWKAIAFIVGGIIAVYILILILATVFTFSPDSSGTTTDSSQFTEIVVEKIENPIILHCGAGNIPRRNCFLTIAVIIA